MLNLQPMTPLNPVLSKAESDMDAVLRAQHNEVVAIDIVSNRLTADIGDVAGKVCTSDLFGIAF
jgi:hypothetical protein